jgi:hypothetical protein
MARVLRAVEAVRKVVALLRDAAAVAARRKVDSMVDMYFLFLWVSMVGGLGRSGGTPNLHRHNSI